MTIAVTEPEKLLLTSIAAAERRNRERGLTRSVKTEEVAWIARRSHGWVAATAGKRLFDFHSGRNKSDARGLGFVHIAGNGYVWLTEKGRAFANAITADVELEAG